MTSRIYFSCLPQKVFFSRIVFGLLFTFVLAKMCPSLANDTAAALAAGGLELKKNEQIEMRSEDLYISSERIEVHYVFKNTSSEDITTVVAFPMPELEYTEGPTAIPQDDNDNYMGFSVTVDNVAITPELLSKASFKDRDITDLLSEFKIPLNPMSSAAEEALNSLNEKDKKTLLKEELIWEFTYDAGEGERTTFSPAWKLKSTYYWTQTFPAGKEVRVSHQYKPSVGGISASSLVNPDMKPSKETLDDYKKRFCTDDAFIKSAEKIGRRNEYAPEYWIDYILTTGGNWAGGRIGNFRLVIDKEEPANLVSFCADGVKKISPTQFEVKKKNYKPERDLNILLLIPHKAEE